jgi:AcrR family transcriptional regulator
VPRPSQIDEQRKRLLLLVCQIFSELGYHRTTTAELAQRCAKHLVQGDSRLFFCR